MPNGIVEGEAKLRDRLDGTSFVFDLVGTEWVFQLQTWPAGWKEPTAGQSFWLSASVEHFALREKQGGPIQIAGGVFSAENLDTELVTQWFGMPVTVEPDCAYERAGEAVNAPWINLYRMRIGADPGVTLTSGTSTRIELNGQPYDAWLTTERRADRGSSPAIPYIVTRAR